MYDIQHIYEANTVDEIIELRKAHPEAEILGGGSDQLINIRAGKKPGVELISIYGIDALRGVKIDEEGTIWIGALESFSHLGNDPIIMKHLPTLGYSALQAGGPQLRNIATIGGNVANGIPSAETPPALLTYNATVVVKGENGERRVPMTEWYKGFEKVALEPTEVLTGFEIRKEDYEGFYGDYIKYAMRKSMDIATNSCAVQVKLNDDGTVAAVRAAYGVAAPVPVRVPKAEEWLTGQKLDDKAIAAFAKKALEELNPRNSWRASKELRVHILEVIGRRCLAAGRDKSEKAKEEA